MSAATANQLSEAYRLAQARIGAATVQALLAAFALVDPANIDDTTAAWLRVVLPIIDAQRAQSATLGANYYDLLRNLELDNPDPFTPTVYDTGDAAQVATSLTVTGPYSLKSATGRGVSLAAAIQTAAARSSAAGMRHAMAGGRETVEAAIHDDPQCVGYVRVTSGHPCAFCAMLNSRGDVYKNEMTAELVGLSGRVRGTRKPGEHYHDGCHCIAKPIFKMTTHEVDSVQQHADLWAESTRGLSGRDALNAFRRALDKSRQAIPA